MDSTNVTLWRRNACGALDIIADEKFQRDAWFGKSKYFSSPDEVYNGLFSDVDIEEFIVSPEIALNDLQKAAGNSFVEKIRIFETLVDESLPPDQVIDHPAWREVRHAAKKFWNLLECEKHNDPRE
jgi:hypothetical protein